MELLNQNQDLDRFFCSVRSARDRLLLLDYDGTLAPFRKERDQAVPYPGVRDLLNSIAENDRTRIIVVSGRSGNELAGLLGLDSTPEIWGSHGGERLIPGKKPRLIQLPERTICGIRKAREWAGAQGLTHIVEDKPCTIAFHWRDLDRDSVDDIRTKVRTGLKDLAEASDLKIQAFDGGLELRPRSFSKATAVSTIIGETPREAAVAYLGDDLTDEDAFRALGDRGLRVLVGDRPRATLADVRIEPPKELLDFLNRWLEAAG